MAKETGTEEQIPEKYRWDELKAKSGVELKSISKEISSTFAQAVRKISGSSLTAEKPFLQKIRQARAVTAFQKSPLPM